MNEQTFIPVLVEPEKARNIGFVARAMKCSGLKELHIVHSTWSEMPEGAFVTGTSAIQILQNAKFYPSVEDAIAGCQGAIAMSRRTIARLDHCELQEVEQYMPPGERIAVLFGRESAGLRIEEASMCQLLVEIQAEEKMSYNLGQAAAMTFYHLANKRKLFTKVQGDEASFGLKDSFKDFVKDNLTVKRQSHGDVNLLLDRVLREWNPDAQTLSKFYGIMRDIAGESSRND